MDLRDSATRARLAFAAVGVAACASLLVALLSQHLLDMQPCPWCVIQRLVAIGIAAVALSVAAVQGRAGRVARAVGAVTVLALAVAGVVAAVYQHTVAAKQFSCAFTWADRFLMSTGLGQWWPAVFEVRATCADAADARLLGLPFELWSGALFALIVIVMAALAVAALRRSLPGRTAAVG